MTELINRPEYLNQLIQHRDVDLVKIVTGIRRCGKSSLLDLFHQYLSDSGVPDVNVIHMNLESLRYRNLTNYLSFYDYVSERIPKSGKTYLIFDELQAVEHWEKAIESFRLDFDVDIYITGSNAYLLSTEFSTLLSGRYVEIRMLPLSFKEFLAFYEFAPSVTTEEKFQRYLQFGGMPILREYQFNEARSNQALEGIYSTVVLRDILQRNNQVDQRILQKIMLFLCSNIGSITSPNNIGNVLSHEGDIQQGSRKNVAGKTVDKYISMLRSAFIFFSVGRYDVKGKQLLKTLGKNYIIDMGFRNMLLGYRDADRGHIIENIVFLELIRRDYRVYIGKVGETEIDFVAEKPNDKLYIQVTESMQSPETRDRELKPLRMIPDNYEKIVLSMDRNYINKNGIEFNNVEHITTQKYLIYNDTFLCGKSGSGKTTLLKQIARIKKCNLNEIWINNLDVNFYDSKTIENNIFYLSDSSYYSEQILIKLLMGKYNNEVKEIINYMNLKSINENELSTGQKQALAFICLLNFENKIILLDEVLNNVDIELKHYLLSIIKPLIVKNNFIVIIDHQNLKDYFSNTVVINE